VQTGVGRAHELASISDEATPLEARIDLMIRHLENTLVGAQANGNFADVVRVVRELRGYLELMRKVQAQERKQTYAFDQQGQTSFCVDDHEPPLEDIYERAIATTLRLRIDLLQESLGKKPTITGPTSLQDLRQKCKELSARVKQRELLMQSEGLGRIWATTDAARLE
jgi:hypothetical protein